MKEKRTKKTFSHYSSSLPNFIKSQELKYFRRNASSYCYNYPNHIIVEITKDCNLKCIMCYRADELNLDLNKQKYMSFQQFKTIMDKIPNFLTVRLTGGECLLNEDVCQMIEYCSEKNPELIGITTNGTLLNQDLAKKLASIPLSHLNVSISSPNKNTFKRINGASLDKIVNNIKYLRSLSNNIIITINVVIMSLNVSELSDIPRLASEIGANKVAYQLVHDWNKNTEKLGIYDYDVLKDVKNEIQKKADYYKIICNINDPIRDYSSFYCTRSFYECFIDADGFITPCCDIVDKPMTKSLYHSDFKKEWNSHLIRELRKKLLRKEIPDVCCCSRALQARKLLLKH